MHLKARVMFQLQQHQMIGKAAVLDAEGGQHPLPAVKGHQGEAFAIEQEFLPHSQFAMGAEVAVIPKPGQHEPVIQGPPEHMLAHVTPAGGGIGQVHVQLRQRRLHLGHRGVHQPRMAVRAAAFIGDPIGPQIALFEHMHLNARRAGGADGFGVEKSGVAVQHDIRDRAVGQERANGGWPLLLTALEGNVIGRGPKGAVAPVEPHPPDLRAGAFQHPAQGVEIGPVGTLQKQKPTILTRQPHEMTFCPVKARMQAAH